MLILNAWNQKSLSTIHETATLIHNGGITTKKEEVKQLWYIESVRI